MPDNRKSSRSPVEGLYTDVEEPPDYIAGTRAVDPLFGETDVPATRNYIVQPPQPATTVSPPPPTSNGNQRRAASPAQAAPAPSYSPYTPVTTSYAPPAISPASAIPDYASEPAVEEVETPATYVPPYVAPAVTPRPVSTPSNNPIATGTPYSKAPGYASYAVPASAPVATGTPTPAYPTPTGDQDASFATAPANEYAGAANVTSSATLATADPSRDYVASIPNLIRELYDQVDEKMSDSPTVGDYLMKTLMAARSAYDKADYASAEFYVESVEAKLRRSQLSMEMSRSPKVILLVLWELGMLVFSASLIAWTYSGLPVALELVTLMRVVGWGGIGGVIGAFYNMPWFVQFREYDPAYNMNYVLRPLQGLLVGAVLYLLSQAGILASSAVVPGLSGPESGDGVMGPVFLYLMGALAGFKQEYVFEFLDNILKTVFRVPSLPTELNTPIPPTSTAQLGKYLKS